MNRIKKRFPFPIQDLDIIKRRMLHWANQGNILLFLDSNHYRHTEGKYECICAVDASHQIINDDGKFSQIKHHFEQHQDWLFGHINYDFKNKLERLGSNHKAQFDFPDSHFFCPETVLFISRSETFLCIESLTRSPDDVWTEIMNTDFVADSIVSGKVAFEKRIGQDEYLDIIRQLRTHIRQGDCYEINFCNENFAKEYGINPLTVFDELNSVSRAPFAAYYRLQDQYLMCASPERFLRKEGTRICAQPIKGTARRLPDAAKDEEQKSELLESIKERAENVMIVDLMRNDLARFCDVGTVDVDELFGIYSFPQVHQMISTISGRLSDSVNLFDALLYAFPMGSMTGAPKVIVMKLIEQYEKARRELFSGTVGYISPEGNFDFNVVIRSLLYNAQSGYLSFQTGGAITYDSVPEQEWEETLLKAMAIEKIFK